MRERRINFLKNNWLCFLIAAQPVLDVIAYWNQNSVATVAGYIRLAIMLALPLHLLFTLKKKKGFVLSMLSIGLFCALHVLNGFRTGYISPVFDIAYMAKVAQMPVLAVCFIFYIRDEGMRKQALRGIMLAGIFLIAFLIVSIVTGTWTATYEGGLGISGWVINDNRCANSIILVTLSVFAVLFSALSERKIVNILLPVLVSAVLIANGTKACYMGLFAIFGGFTVFMPLRRLICGEKIKKVFALTLVLLMIGAAAVYPVTPRAKVDEAQAASALKNQSEFDGKLLSMGYDLNGMSLEEKLSDPVLRGLFEEFYYEMFGYLNPHMFQRFGTEKVLAKYGMTTEAATLIDVRIMKINYASLIWDECDVLTRLVGFESTEVCKDGSYDMENDWPALFFYYGYLGFAMYVVFILYFIYRIIRRLIRDLKGSFSFENFALLLCLILQLGLAQFSGAILRRPNVSVYLSLVLALIYYKTAVLPLSREKPAGEGAA